MGAYGDQHRKYVFSAIFDHLWSQVSGCMCEVMGMKDNMGHVMEWLQTF
jgi:hypothetical protein